MRLAISSLLIIALLAQGHAFQFDSKKLDQKIEESASSEDKKNDKRGATVEIQASESAYITPAPSVQLSHGPTIVPAVSITPGIVYAQQKQIVATASPSQVYAKPSPHLAKVAEVVAPAPVNNVIVTPLHQQQVYQTIPKVSLNSPTYAITAPVPAHLAYSKHQIIPQQVYHQPQVHYAAYSQPQPFYVQPQQVSYVQPHVNYIQPQAQLFHPQPQVYHTQPNVYHAQPQVYHAQPQLIQQQHVPYVQPQHVQVYQHQPIAYHQPQVAAYSPVVVAQPVAKVAYSQPQVYHTQQAKGDAVSYTSFAQSELSGVHYPNPLKVIPAPSLVSQAPVIAKQAYQQPHYYNQPQVQYQAYNSQYQHPQNYYNQHQQGYSSPSLNQKISYAQPLNNGYSSQYYGKNGQNTQNSYSSYSH